MAENTTLLGTLFSAGKYHPEQGKYVRGSVLAACLLLLAFGALELNQALAALSDSVYICDSHPEVGELKESGPCPRGDRTLREEKRNSWFGERITTLSALGKELTLYNAVYVAAGAFIGVAWIVWRVFHWQKPASFLIETEGEMRKVAWPPRKEFLGASLVVIILTMFISTLLYAVDSGLSWVMLKLKIGI